MSKNVVIVESPAKCKTIKKYLGNDYDVIACYGHICDLPKNNLGVDVDKSYNETYEILEDKQKVINDINKLCKKATMVYIATDPDREGEAIAWHLANTLNLTHAKTERIVFNEITKDAIQKAITNPRQINNHLVNAQQTRRIMDRIVGFELSPILWKKIRTGLSAGRVQSVAVRIIVEHEKDIRDFSPENYYKINASFKNKNNVTLDAELNQKIRTKDEAKEILKNSLDNKFKIDNITKRNSNRKPPAPLTTSTLQQEAYQKLGNSVSKTMSLAQKLYEKGFITYMRTDSTTLSEEAMQNIKSFILNTFGEKYYHHQIYKTKSQSAQEGHEAIRPTTMSQVNVSDDNGEQKLYELIRHAAIASQMSSAVIEKTTAKVNTSTSLKTYTYEAKGEIVLFDGFMAIATSSKTSKVLPSIEKNQELDIQEILATEKFTRPPSRYSEAKLVKKLEELGIGRPSTYAPTISTIQKRGYVEKLIKEGEQRTYSILSINKNKVEENLHTELTGAESGKLAPNDIGILVNNFLVDQFKDILDYSFTATLEKDFDDIAHGNKQWKAMIKNFYKDFHKQTLKVQENSERISGERLLGQDPKTNKNIYVRMGRYGPIVQLGESANDDTDKKPQFAGLKKDQSMDTLTLAEALELFKLPRTVGDYKDNTITAAIGRFGPYIKYEKLFVSLKDEDPLTVTLEKSIELIEEKREFEKNKYIHTFDKHDPPIYVLNGPYGPYIKYGKKNVKIPKDIDPKKLSLNKCIELSEQKKESKRKKK